MDLPETFVGVIPDDEAAGLLAARLTVPDGVRLDHASGRPWLRARLNADTLVVGSAGTTRVALVGPTSATEDDLTALAGKDLDAAGIVARASRFDGNFSVYASLDGDLLAVGTVSQNRRVFHAPIGPVRMLADRADLLADLGGFSVSPAAVGMHLLPNLPHPLNDLTMWDEVAPVAGGEYIVVRDGGRGVEVRTWWRRPAPEHSRAEGAGRLRAALEASLAARTRTGINVAADLSGGLDSTPVCYFAAQGPRGVLARTFYTDDPGGREDLRWAETALDSMPGVREHEIFSVETLPDFYGGLAELRLRLDEPSQTYMAAPRLLAMLDRDVEAGIGMHFTGIGGDHLFRRVSAWDHDLARKRPLTAWKRARSDARAGKVPAHSTLRQLTNRQGYAAWLNQALQKARQRSDTIELPGISDWGAPLSFPEWMSDDAVDAVIERMLELAGDAGELSNSVAEHFDLYTIHEAGRVARGMSYLGQPQGVLLDSPLVDDRVLEAVFAVSYDERDTPMEWKPLMKEAMRGLLPDQYLKRATKIGGGPQAVRGYAQHYEEMTGIWEESGVLDQGLLDRDALMMASRPSGTKIPSPMTLTLTNVALFLRDLRSPVSLISPEDAR